MNILVRISLFLLVSTLHVSAQVHIEDYHTGQLYVRLNESFPLATSRIPEREIATFFESYQVQFGITEVKAAFWFSKSASNRIYRISFNQSALTEQFIKQLEASGKVIYAERIPISRKALVPNDLGPNSSATGGQWYLYKIKAQQAWDIQAGGIASVKVGVVDDAVDYTHPELSGVILPGYDIASDDFDVMPPDPNWDHGTHVCGLIGANTNNSAGMASLAYGVKIYPVKVTNDTDPNTLINEYEGVAYAVTQGVDVVNMSWGSTIPYQTAQTIINEAYNAGVVLVAAAGNDNSSVVNYPAGYPGVISVAATSSIDTRSSFSSFGSSVDISAPGSLIWSLAPENTTAIKNGTSFAAPLVTAAVALMLSNDPSLSPDQLEECLLNSTDNIDIFNPNYIGQLGTGRLNIQQALICLNAESQPINAWLSNVVSPSQSSCESNLTPFIRVVNSGTDTLESMTITSKIDNGFTYTDEWNGEILPGLSALIPVHNQQVVPGNHLLQVTVLGLINGDQQDAFLSNNTLVYPFTIQNSVGGQLPFFDNFESNSFSTHQWTISNPEVNSTTWEIASSFGSNTGQKSARLPYFTDFVGSTRDFLISPSFNLSGYTSLTLSFDYAYQQRFPGITDSMIVSVSSDCGNSWNRVWARGEDGIFSFATTSYNGSFFIPQTAYDWCDGQTLTTCGDIDLSAYAGMTGFQFRFEGFNGLGNNIYLDNVQLSGVSEDVPPIAGFSAQGSSFACTDAAVQFSNTSLNSPETYSWTFESGNPANSTDYQPLVTWSQPGLYDVELIVTKNGISDTLSIPDFIHVYDSPTLEILTESDSICPNSTITLTAAGANLYYWLEGPSLNATNAASVEFSPTATTLVSLSGVSDEGCFQTVSKTITILPQPGTPFITITDFSLQATDAISYVWYVNGLEINDSDTSNWMPLVNGNYNVRIYDEYGCTSISNPFNVNWVGLDEVVQNPLQMIPNPANEYVQLQSGSMIQTLQLYSVSGQLIETHTVEALQSTIQTEKLADGLYVVCVETSKGIQHLKLLVNH